MIMKNKNGQIGKTLTTIPVMILIFVILAFFIVASIWSANNRSQNMQNSFSNYEISPDSIIFKTMAIDGENKLVAEAAIENQYPGGEVLPLEKPGFYPNFAIAFRDFAVSLPALPNSDKAWQKSECISLAIENWEEGKGRVINLGRLESGAVSVNDNKMYKFNVNSGSGSYRNHVITIYGPDDSESFTYDQAQTSINGETYYLLYYYRRC